jgi:hypothetical protein
VRKLPSGVATSGCDRHLHVREDTLIVFRSSGVEGGEWAVGAAACVWRSRSVCSPAQRERRGMPFGPPVSSMVLSPGNPAAWCVGGRRDLPPSGGLWNRLRLLIVGVEWNSLQGGEGWVMHCRCATCWVHVGVGGFSFRRLSTAVWGHGTQSLRRLVVLASCSSWPEGAVASPKVAPAPGAGASLVGDRDWGRAGRDWDEVCQGISRLLRLGNGMQWMRASVFRSCPSSAPCAVRAVSAAFARILRVRWICSA